MDKAAFPTKGGMAFYLPKEHELDLERIESEMKRDYEGMTLREWYRGMALQGLLANPEIIDAEKAKEIADGIRGGQPIKRVADQLADIMVEDE